MDAVLIASTDATHADITIACIEAGKPVLCEKPLATTLADAERVLRAELATGRRLVQVGFMREYDHAHRDLYDLLHSGAIGAALKVRSLHVNPRFVRELTIDSVITNSLIHDIHSARWIMPSEVESAYVQWVPADRNRPRSARLADIQLVFADGAIGSLEYNGDSGYGYEVTVEVTSETGTSSPQPTTRARLCANQAPAQARSRRTGPNDSPKPISTKRKIGSTRYNEMKRPVLRLGMAICRWLSPMPAFVRRIRGSPNGSLPAKSPPYISRPISKGGDGVFVPVIGQGIALEIKQLLQDGIGIGN